MSCGAIKKGALPGTFERHDVSSGGTIGSKEGGCCG